MVYQVIAGFCGLLTLLLLLLSARALLNKAWIAGFLRGCAGFLLLALAILLGLSAQDIATYKSVSNEQSIMTLSVRLKEGNRYQIDMQAANGDYFNSEIEGQQWQLNVRMIKWVPLFTAIGFRTGYRLDSIQGRYLELQLGGKPQKSGMQLSGENLVDIWQFMQDFPGILGSAEAYSSTPGFIPLSDGAIYEVVLSGTNLAARPMNEAAKAAMASW
jgi:hypothetical protein